MVDKTNVFKAVVRALKSRNKATGVVSDNNNKSSILKHTRQRGDFEEKAKNVVNSITELRDFLVQHRKEYISAGCHLLSEASKMTDAERDQIDNDSQIIIKTCQETIRNFKQEAFTQKVLPQIREHRVAVMELLETYLKAICKIYSEQRAVRVKRVVDRKKISRLEPERKMQLRKNLHTGTEREQAEGTEKQHIFSAIFSDTEDEELTTEDKQLFDQENHALMNEMNSLMSEVKQIEGKVVEISRLQEIFSEKVWEQEKDIDQINNIAVGTTENVREGNEEIREAIKNNAGFRVWILFFLVLCSIALLFLDWYNA